MARFWIEKFDQQKGHRDHLWQPGDPSQRHNDALIPQPVYCVRVCTFTFEFLTMRGIHRCLDFFSRKTHPSSIIPRDELHLYGGDNMETQRWYERLPLWLFEEPKRLKVIKALEEAIARCDSTDARHP